MLSLRVGFDGHSFDSPAGGVRRYVRELTRALHELDPQQQLIAVGAGAGLSLPRGVVRMPARGWLPTNLGWCIDGLPRAVRRARIDVFHAPAYTAPIWGVQPLIVTLHDVSYERHPEWYPYRMDRARRWFYRRSALVANMVITDSEFSRREIEAAYGIRGDRVRVIPLGVGAPFTPASDDGLQPNRRRVPVILHVGDLHPRRNIDILIDVLVQLRTRKDALASTELVLAGVDRGTGGPLAARAKALGVDGAIRFVADADDNAVVALMREASVLAYPSVYEGFGLPALEAMACGTPVIASRAAAIPEVVGEAGLLADPHDVCAWYAAIVEVLSSPARAGTLRQAGLARASMFSWRQTAVKTLSVYQELAEAASTKA